MRLPNFRRFSFLDYSRPGKIFTQNSLSELELPRLHIGILLVELEADQSCNLEEKEC